MSDNVEIGWDAKHLVDRPELWSLPLARDDQHTLAAADDDAHKVRSAVHAFVDAAIERVGFAHIAGFVDPGRSEDDITRTLLFVLDGIGVVVPQNGAGDLLQVLRDRDGDGVTALGFHCDTCDLLVLLCLQPAADGQGFTRLASARKVDDILTAEDRDTLSLLREDWTYDRTGRAGPQIVVSPILFTQPDGTIGCYYQTRTVRASLNPDRPADARRLAALDVLDEVLHRPGVGFDLMLAAGDLLLIRNSRVLHGRSPYIDQPGPKARRILRLWVDDVATEENR
ncbi:TauD/TfdA family dioxygenase [Nocardia sp. NPDC050378]|uniref:TauD/TfdA family dioxygenase n=1 Tax=Nocardia sp. NPDC050378 TaxID=3155400 RepID=UPI0033FAAAF2